MSKLLAQSTVDIRGNLDKLTGGPAIQYDLGTIIASFIGMALIVGAIAALGYMILGAIQWITSGGDTGKVGKARDKIMQSVVGLAVLSATWAVFLIIQYFFGISISDNVGGGASNGGGNGSAQICQVGQRSTFTGYCNGGTAQMQCFGPGQGATVKANYNHWEPCGCISGSEQSGVDYSSC